MASVRARRRSGDRLERIAEVLVPHVDRDATSDRARPLDGQDRDVAALERNGERRLDRGLNVRLELRTSDRDDVRELEAKGGDSRHLAEGDEQRKLDALGDRRDAVVAARLRVEGKSWVLPSNRAQRAPRRSVRPSRREAGRGHRDRRRTDTGLGPCSTSR